VHGTQHQQQVVDAVVRQHHHRLVQRQPQAQQALRHGAHGAAQLAPGQAAPVAAGVALGHRQRVGRLDGPALQPVAHAAGIGLQRFGRAQHEAAVVEGDARHARRRQLLRIVEEGDGHAGLRGGRGPS
jgi:hypothetical protein